MAIARALTSGSIRSSNSTTSAASPAGTIRKVISAAKRGQESFRAVHSPKRLPTPFPSAIQRPQQLLMDAAEPAVRHDHHEVAWAMLCCDRADDVVDRLGLAGRMAAPIQGADETGHRQPLRFRQRRSEHRRDQDLVGARERARELVLKYSPARRSRSRLEYRPDARLRVRRAKTGQRFGYG